MSRELPHRLLTASLSLESASVLITSGNAFEEIGAARR
jgi:hypothetical protein